MSSLYPVPSLAAFPSCRFLKTLLITTTWSCYFFVKRNQLESVFRLLGNIHAVIQVFPDGVVDNHNCCCYSFAACTVDVIMLFSRLTVSALTSGLSRYSAQPTPCTVPLHFLRLVLSPLYPVPSLVVFTSCRFLETLVVVTVW